MDVSSIPAFTGLAAGLCIFFLIYAIYAPVRTTRKRTINQDIFGEDAVGAVVENKYARPILDNFMPTLPENILPEKTAYKYNELLRVSGNPWKITAEELFVLQIAGALIGALVGLPLALFNSVESVPGIAFPAVLALLGFFLPYSKHTSLREKRMIDVQKNLPEALDLLQVVMETNVAFQPALRKVASQLPNSFLKSELQRIDIEMQAGATVETSVKSFARSNTADEAQAFATAIIQSQKTGADMTDTLRRQAEIARQNHEARINRMIARLGTTLFVPITLFMIPAFMIIFLAPMMSTIASTLGW